MNPSLTLNHRSVHLPLTAAATLGLVALTVTEPAWGVTRTWNGVSFNGNWNNAFNWTLFTRPSLDGTEDTRFTPDTTGTLGFTNINVDIFPNVKSINVPIHLIDNDPYTFSGNRIVVQDLISNRNKERLTFNSTVRLITAATIEGPDIVFNGGIELSGGLLPGSAGDLTLTTDIPESIFYTQIEEDIFVNSPISGFGHVTIDRTQGDSVVRFKAANTYTGRTTVDRGGELVVQGSGRLPSKTEVKIEGDGILEFDGVSQSIDALIAGTPVLDGGRGNGEIRLTNGSVLTIGNDNGSGFFEGAITGSGGLTKIGTGTQTLARHRVGSSFASNNTPPNSYTGPTRVLQGTLELGTGTALVDSPGKGQLPEGTDLHVGGGATMRFNGITNAIGDLSGSGNLELGTNPNMNLTVGLGDVDSFNFFGTVSGDGKFSKIGTGNFEFYGTLEHTGATRVTEGILSFGAFGKITQTSEVEIINAGSLHIRDSLAQMNVVGDITVSDPFASMLYLSGSLTMGGSLINSGGVAISQSLDIPGGITNLGAGSIQLRQVINTPSIVINGSEFIHTHVAAIVRTILPGNQLTVSDQIIVGTDLDGIFEVEFGGSATTDMMFIARDVGGAGTVNVNGDIPARHSTLTVETGLYVGGGDTSCGGAGVLDLGMYSTTTVNSVTKVWNDGTVKLHGGALTTDSLENLGTLHWTGDTTTPVNAAVTNVANLAGVLDVAFTDGFTPTVGDEFEILTAGQIVGGFTQYTGDVFDIGENLAIVPTVRHDATSGSDLLVLVATAPGDTNLDFVVDAADLNTLALNWQQSASGWAAADFNNDGFVDAADLNLLALNWQSGVPLSLRVSFDDAWSAATAHTVVPEPATAVTVTVILLAPRCRKRVA